MKELQVHFVGTIKDQTILAMVDKATDEIFSISVFKDKTKIKDCHFGMLEMKEKIIQSLLREREAYGDLKFTEQIISNEGVSPCTTCDSPGCIGCSEITKNLK